MTLPYEMYQLPNGLTVILSRDTSIPVVAVDVWYHVGAGNEEPGRTGFAHLFEHMMFQGSANVPKELSTRIIDEAGGSQNGYTSADLTAYFETVPSNFLETALWIEADRMGALLPGVTQEKLDNQRDVVKNERRERVENAPYGFAYETVLDLLYPDGHPYEHAVGGSMADLTAASLTDVHAFFERYYGPNNASLAIVGDFDPAEARRLVARYFGATPRGPAVTRPNPATVVLREPRYRVLEDRIRLPELRVVWPSVAQFAEDDAALGVLARILASGRSSRLYQRLVYSDQSAQFVSTTQVGELYGGRFQVIIRAKEGVDLDRVQKALDEEIARIQHTPPDAREVERAINNVEAGIARVLQTPLDRAERLNGYFMYAGDPGYLDRDFGRYREVTPAAVQRVAREYLGAGRAVLSVVPAGQLDLQAAP